MLNPTPPPVYIIPSNQPGTKRGPDSRGIRICIAQIGRSCSLHQGYVTFTDGSAYVYDAPSNTEFEALCDQIQRGRTFNFQVRRSRGGYVKGFTPPGDYEIIYTYPPYPGVTPAACGVPFTDWASLTWSGSREFSPFDGSTSGSGLHFTGTMPNNGITAFGYGSSSLDVQSDASSLDVKVTNTSGTSTFDVSFTQNIGGGGTVFFPALAPGANNTQNLVLVQGVGVFDGEATWGTHESVDFAIDLTPLP